MTSNFHFIDIKPTIDKSQVNSIKEAIFARAQEKSNALAQEKNENYATQVQNDVMDIAKESLNIPEVNPFNQFIKSINTGINAQGINISNSGAKEDAAAAPKEKELKHNIESVSDSSYTNSVRNETMKAARTQFQQRSLTDTLNFLNTQAAITMAKNVKPKKSPFG